MNSLGSLPVFFLACSISSGFMLRLALAMSMVPRSSAAMPTPEPPPETSTPTVGWTFVYSSAQAWATFTMVSEPRTWIVVVPPRSPLWPQELSSGAAAASARATGTVIRLGVVQ